MTEFENVTGTEYYLGKPAEDEAEIRLDDLIFHVLNYWKWMILAGVVCGLIGLGIAWVRTPKVDAGDPARDAKIERLEEARDQYVQYETAAKEGNLEDVDDFASYQSDLKEIYSADELEFVTGIQQDVASVYPIEEADSIYMKYTAIYMKYTAIGAVAGIAAVVMIAVLFYLLSQHLYNIYYPEDTYGVKILATSKDEKIRKSLRYRRIGINDYDLTIDKVLLNLRRYANANGLENMTSVYILTSKSSERGTEFEQQLEGKLRENGVAACLVERPWDKPEITYQMIAEKAPTIMIEDTQIAKRYEIEAMMQYLHENKLPLTGFVEVL